MMVARAESGPHVDEYLQMLEEELGSCCQPKVKNVAEASEVELIRDLHRVLTGNGDATHGLIFKVAAANVNIRLLSCELNSISERVNKEVCAFNSFKYAHDQNEALSASHQRSVQQFGKLLWANKSLILLLLLTAVVYVRTLYTPAPTDSDARLQQLLERKVEQLLLEKTQPPSP